MQELRALYHMAESASEQNEEANPVFWLATRAAFAISGVGPGRKKSPFIVEAFSV